MKKVIEIISALITVFSCAIHSAGQIPMETKTIQSPNVATLGRYGDVPVSLFTGVPAISIPIYEVRTGSHTIPIALSYHSAGVMPEQHPGWVGLGWSLMCGGCISRIVNDMPDEYSVEDTNTEAYKNMGFYYNYSCLDNEYWNTSSYINDDIIKTKGYIKDTQPDKFSFNFNGYSGNFYINHKGEAQAKCDRDIEVEIIMYGTGVPDDVVRNLGTESTHPFTGFVITTEDGTRYTFGMADNAVEYSINFWIQDNQEWIATSWHLTNISYPDGESVDFVYERGIYTYQLGHSISNIASAVKSGSNFLTSEYYSMTATPVQDTLSVEGNLISPVYLKRMNFNGGSIDFLTEQTTELRYDKQRLLNVYTYLTTNYPNNNYLSIPLYIKPTTTSFPDCLDYLQWRKLSSMEVNDNAGNCVRKYKFDYTDDPDSRLMLESFSEDTEMASEQSYRFVYNNPDSLPPYLSQMVDHWGYYNGRIADTKKPQYFNKRESDSCKMKYGILEKIIYPTGGYTRFEFEANKCHKILSNNRSMVSVLDDDKVVGGLRIKRIFNSHTGMEKDETMTKEYFYVSDFLKNGENASVSSGVLGCYPKYDFTIKQDSPGYSVVVNIFSSQPVLSGGNNALGSHIGYTEVVEKNSNGSFSIYKFTNFDTGFMDYPPEYILNEMESPYEPFSSREENRGKLTSVDTYDSNGRLMKRKEYLFLVDDNSYDNFVRSVKAGFYKQGNAVYAEITAYKIFTYSMRKEWEKEHIYEQGTDTPATTVTTYSYNGNKLLSQVSFNYGDGEYIKRYRYPADFQSNGTYSAMVDKHILSPVVEYKEINKIGATEYQQKYDRYDYSLSNGFYLPYKFSSSANGLPEEREAYTYNKYGKILTITKDKADTTVYLWGYGGRYVVAEIRGLSISEIESVTGDIDEFCEKESPEFVKLYQLRMKYPYAHIKTCKYEVLVGPEAISDQRGVSEYYMYDDLGRLRRVKDNDGKFKALYEYNFKPHTP